MKEKRKPRSNRVASNDMLGDFTAWILYDSTDTYTGSTLWTTKRLAEKERKFQGDIGSLPRDGAWRIRKVHVRFA